MSEGLRAPLIALAASIGLIGAYLAFGGASYDPATVADPCEQRDVALLEDRDLFEGIALSSLDGAACDLGVSREQLTLALADEEATAEFAEAYGIGEEEIEDAVRAGLERAVDDAAAAGRVDGIEETLLREIAERAPVGPAIEGLQALPRDDSAQGLIELLGGISQGELPGLGELEGLIP